MSRQNIAKEIDHFKKHDWYRLESTDELDEDSLERSVIDLIAKTGINSKTKVLEIASGGGQFGLRVVAKTKADYTGLDLMTELVSDARKRAEKRRLNATFIQGDAHRLPFKDNYFDVVFVTYSLHHFPKESLDQVTKEVKRVLKNGGYYYILEPNGLNPIMFTWWVLNSPERIFPLGRSWRENRHLSVNETIIYPWQITGTLKGNFESSRFYTLGFVPKIGFIKKYENYWNKLNSFFGTIPLWNKLGGSFVVIAQK